MCAQSQRMCVTVARRSIGVAVGKTRRARALCISVRVDWEGLLVEDFIIVALNMTDEYLFVGGYDGQLCVIEPATGHAHTRLHGHTQRITRIVSSTFRAHLFISASCDGTARVWARGHTTGIECVYVLRGHTDAIFDTACNEHEFAKPCVRTTNYCRIVTGSKDRTVRVWDVRTGVCTRILTGHTDLVHLALVGLRWRGGGTK
jgi:WD40 repeat protein